MKDSESRWISIVAPLLIGACAPVAILFYMEWYLNGQPFLDAASGIFSKMFAEGYHYFWVTSMAMIPFVVLSFSLWYISRRISSAPAFLALLSLCGLAATLIPMVYSYIQVWKHTQAFNPVVFMFVPIYCTVTMALGLFIGWVLRRRG